MDTGPGNRLERTTFFFLAFLLIRLFIDLLWTSNCLIEHECFLVEAHYLDAHFFNRFFQGETCFHNVLFQSFLLLCISAKRVHLCLHMYTNTMNKHLQANHFGHANKLPVTQLAYFFFFVLKFFHNFIVILMTIFMQKLSPLFLDQYAIFMQGLKLDNFLYYFHQITLSKDTLQHLSS